MSLIVHVVLISKNRNYVVAYQKRWKDAPGHGPTIHVVDEANFSRNFSRTYHLPAITYGTSVFDTRLKPRKSK